MSFLSLLDMVLPLPVRFDQNEWFILLNIVFGFTWVLFCPKRYPTVISVMLILYTDTVALLFDHTTAGTPLDLYDINDQKKYELFDDITYFMYAPYSLLTVYLYDKFNPKGLFITAYVVVWSLLALVLEWVAVKLHVFTYNNWSLLYSFAFYLFTTALYLRFFRFLLKYFNESRANSVIT